MTLAATVWINENNDSDGHRVFIGRVRAVGNHDFENFSLLDQILPRSCKFSPQPRPQVPPFANDGNFDAGQSV